MTYLYNVLMRTSKVHSFPMMGYRAKFDNSMSVNRLGVKNEARDGNSPRWTGVFKI